MELRGCLWHEGVNGLGIGPNWMRWCLPYRKKFGKAARKHDECYDVKGDREARKAYDLLFLCSCLTVSKNALQRVMAYVYYALVRAFGWAFYRYDKVLIIKK